MTLEMKFYHLLLIISIIKDLCKNIVAKQTMIQVWNNLIAQEQYYYQAKKTC